MIIKSVIAVANSKSSKLNPLLKVSIPLAYMWKSCKQQLKIWRTPELTNFSVIHLS